MRERIFEFTGESNSSVESFIKPIATQLKAFCTETELKDKNEKNLNYIIILPKHEINARFERNLN